MLKIKKKKINRKKNEPKGSNGNIKMKNEKQKTKDNFINLSLCRVCFKHLLGVTPPTNHVSVETDFITHYYCFLMQYIKTHKYYRCDLMSYKFLLLISSGSK